ncbi:MAG: replicative DNA helicase [Firmicutes bacterium]|nr:replicative DNA helicase [Bacillota bacterium]MDY5857137.1 replicative DNA helicase [Anaerovoracaceae bacterium]
MVERIPPHNEEAERCVLGAAMLSKDALYDVIEEVTADDFYNENHREIFNAIMDLYRDSTPVDMLTVCETLKKKKVLDLVGGRAYIATLTTEVPSTVNAGEYARIVSEKASLRQLISTAEEIVNKGYEGKDDTREILDFAEAGIFQIGQNRQKSDYTQIQDILLKNVEIIDAASQNQGKVVGIPTGFKDLDELTSGLHRSDLIILAARPAMGKTAFALNIAQQTAVKAGSSVLIFSLEMSKEQLGQRLLAIQARVEMQKLKTGNLDRKDWDRLNMALDELHSSKIFIDDTPGISIMEMRNKCRRLKAEHGLDLVIIDYLQLMQFDGRADSRQQEISAISRHLKLLAREMDCPVIVLSQLSRAPELRQDHRPILSDLRESGSIEQDADIVIFLYRDDYYNPDNSEKHGICEVNIAKHRSGPTDKVELTWVERYTKFSDKAM